MKASAVSSVMSHFTTRVVPDDTHGYRILVSRYGLESRAGTRLQRGLPGSGNMFTGDYVGADREQLEKTANDLQKYLNDYENSRTRRRKTRR